MTDRPEYQYETFIRTDADRIWQALTDASFTSRYFYATHVSSGWAVGDEVTYRYADGRDVVVGRVLESDPPRRLSITWRALYDEAMAKEQESRVTFEIEDLGGACRLRVIHDRFQPGSKTLENISQGWSAIICSLKSLLETGEPLPLAGNEA